MKLKNIFEFLGFRRKPRHYFYEIADFDLDPFGSVKYAQWKHPAESKKSLWAREKS